MDKKPAAQGCELCSVAVGQLDDIVALSEAF
jgi:hypothetical protein